MNMTSIKEQVFNKKTWWDYLILSIGTFLLAYAIIAFWAEWGLVTGGLSGLAIIVAEYSYGLGFYIPIWLTNFALNVPLLVLGFFIIPTRYFLRTIYASQFLTLTLWLSRFLPAPESTMLLATVFGGVVGGVGLGLVFRANGTTGGTTLASEIIKRKILKHVPLAAILFGVDTSIIIIGLLVFGPINTMYAIIGVFVCSRVTDVMIEGMSFSKAVFIISKDADAIGQTILKDMNRGCTALDSHGMFTKQPQTMLLCVVSAKEIINLKQLVYSMDEKAFVIVADVREVLGEGFKTGREAV